jgi:hypothetical protein
MRAPPRSTTCTTRTSNPGDRQAIHAERRVMGRLTYDSTNVIEFDDRLLAHLQIVIGEKLRLHQSFYFSWKNDPKAGDGRSTLWMHPSMPLHFKYTTAKQPFINREWLRILSASANTPSGLQILPEPATNDTTTSPALTGHVMPIPGPRPGDRRSPF